MQLGEKRLGCWAYQVIIPWTRLLTELGGVKAKVEAGKNHLTEAESGAHGREETNRSNSKDVDEEYGEERVDKS